MLEDDNFKFTKITIEINACQRLFLLFGDRQHSIYG